MTDATQRPEGDHGRHRLYQMETAGYSDLVAFVGWLALAGWLRDQGRVWPVSGLGLVRPLLGLGLWGVYARAGRRQLTDRRPYPQG